MRNRSPERFGGRRLVAPPVPLGQRILTVTDDGASAALYTTAAPHGLSGTYTVGVSGTSGGGLYDNTGIVTESQPSATTFVTGQPYLADAAGGTYWAYQ